MGRIDQVALLVAVALEVGLVPAGALQPEHRRGDQATQRELPALRALAQRRIADLLQRLELVRATPTAVFVDRHSFLASLCASASCGNSGPFQVHGPGRRGRPPYAAACFTARANSR